MTDTAHDTAPRTDGPRTDQESRVSGIDPNTDIANAAAARNHGRSIMSVR